MDRIILFLGPLIILVLGEFLRPRRALILPRHKRWPHSVLLLGIGSFLSRLLVPAGLAGIAVWAAATNFGLFHVLSWPIWFEVLIGFILFDIAVWGQHVAMHRSDTLWRFHRVHHSDPDFDVFTALRFHPGELIISVLWKVAVIALLGVPAWAALWFEVILNVSAMFNHSNIHVPRGWDRVLRTFLVTPDMHRVHHSVEHSEANSNFGFCIPWWDRLFGLYQDQPNAGHMDMQIGQQCWRGAEAQSILKLLTQPRH